MKLTKIEKLQDLVYEYHCNEYIAFDEMDELVNECIENDGDMLFTLQRVTDSPVIFAAKTYDVNVAYHLMFMEDYTVIGIDYDPDERLAYFTEA